MVVVGWNDTTATVQSVKDSGGNNYTLGDRADERHGIATVDLLSEQHRGREQHGDGDLQPTGGFPRHTDTGISGSDSARCDGGGEREQRVGEQRSGDDHVAPMS